MKIKVKIETPEDLVELNEIMTRMKDVEFDVSHGSTCIDGKSLYGMLALSDKELVIHTNASGEKLKEFKTKIAKFCV